MVTGLGIDIVRFRWGMLERVAEERMANFVSKGYFDLEDVYVSFPRVGVKQHSLYYITLEYSPE